MRQPGHFNAGGANPTAVISPSAGAIDIGGISQGKGKFPASGRAKKHLGMAYPAFGDRLDEFLLEDILTYDFAKLHAVYSFLMVQK